MKWVAHQIRLPDSSATMEHQEGHSQRVLRYVQLVADVLAKPFDQMRVLDLACFEGGFTFELALQGAQAVGLDVRRDNLDKCEAVKARIGLRNCTFVQDDVRNLSRAKHGSFDLVLCLGILYHLTAEAGVDLLKGLYEVCDRAVIIGTHVALLGEEQIEVGSEHYSGRTFREFAPGTSQEIKTASAQSSLDNETSFWMTEESLCRCLKAAGFTSVMKVLMPAIPLNMHDRVALVALKGSPIQLLSCDRPTQAGLPERSNPSVLLASYSDKELVSIYRKRSSLAEFQGAERLREQLIDAEIANQQLKKQIAVVNTNLKSVLNSKGWRLLNRYRTVRDQVRSLRKRLR